MTRREEIVKATKECREDYVGLGRHLTLDDIADAFEKGVYWDDKTIIEKACECLRQTLYNTPIFEHDEDETPVNYVCASCCDSVEEFIENFRRAMEGYYEGR